MKTITVTELQKLLNAKPELILLDVRNMTSKNALEIDPSPDAKNRGKREAFLKK